MKPRRLFRNVIDTFTINGKTFRFMYSEEVTGYKSVVADEWTGWRWQRRHTWENAGTGPLGFPRGKSGEQA